ncbi:MAG: PAS domain-containing sensor histidine kinase [Dehalococcoidia bacterium]
MDSVLLQALVDSAPDGILLVHPRGHIVFVNAQAERLFRYSAQELVGRTIEDLVPDRFRSVHRAHQAAYHAHPVARPMGSGLELSARCSDGSELPVEISLGAIPTEEGTYVTAIVRDMTERRAFEAERRQLMAQAELQRDRERIARDLHDGVMQSIYAVGLSLLETRGAIEPHAPEALPALDEAVQELRQVIDDIRTYVMGLPLNRLESDVAELLREVVDEVRADSAFEVALDVSPGLAELPGGQAQALYHLVREALTNVRKHAMATHAEVRLAQDGDAMLLEVRDDGCGFDPDAERDHQHMGLRNMRSRVEALSGVLDIESRPGAGTVVRVRLPSAA